MCAAGTREGVGATARASSCYSLLLGGGERRWALRALLPQAESGAPPRLWAVDSGQDGGEGWLQGTCPGGCLGMSRSTASSTVAPPLLQEDDAEGAPWSGGGRVWRV